MDFKIENAKILDDRFRKIIISKRGDLTRPEVAKKLSQVVGRTVPTTTYAGYELCRNPPRDVLLALIKLYKLSPWQVLGLEEPPQKK